jgi:hypothetical protein
MRSPEIGFAKTSQKVFPVPKGWTYALTNAVKLSIQQVRSISSNKPVRLTLTGTALHTVDDRPSGQGVQEIAEIECGAEVLDDLD